MIKTLYKDYFQKSRAFLFPLLNISRTSKFQPNKTYISWEGKVSVNDKKLICLYQSKDIDIEKLKKHEFFSELFTLEDGSIAVLFNLSKHSKDWECFLTGKYSKMSANTKKRIKEYYGEKSVEGEYIESYLNPKDYFKTYSELLGIEIDLLESLGEVCSSYDPHSEDLFFDQKKYLSQ